MAGVHLITWLVSIGAVIVPAAIAGVMVWLMPAPFQDILTWLVGVYWDVKRGNS